MKIIRQHIVLPENEDLAVLPGIKRAVVNGEAIVAIPHNLEAVRYLRNLQIPAPSPIHYNYRWSGLLTPLRHQRITSDMCTIYQRMFVLNGMGTGKTLAALWAADYLMKIRQVQRVLVISPRSTLRDVWDNTIYQHFPHISHDVLRGTPEVCKEKLAKKLRIYIINPESARVRVKLLSAAGFDMVIVDEVAQVARNNTLTYKAIKTLTDKAVWVWGMTGTPTPNAPTDAYYQVKLVRPSDMPISFFAFRDLVMRKVSQFKWEPRENAEQIVAQYMRPCVRFSIEDCIDLPPTTYVDLEVDLTAEQQKHYKTLLDDSFTSIHGIDITAINAAALISKLIQAACGVVYGKGKATADLDITHRYEALTDVIDGCAEKTIVFVPFTSVISRLYDKLVSDGYTVAIVDGNVGDSARAIIFNRFRNEPRNKLQVILAHPRAMSHGLTLVAASTIVWYAPYPSNETYAQANARIVRPGQTKHTTIVRISATATERNVYRVLEKKGKMQQALLDLLSGVQHGV